MIKYCNGLNYTDFTLPNETVTIKEEAFKNNTSLKRVDLNNVQEINREAFYNCINLKEIIGYKVKVATELAFHKTAWINSETTPENLGTVLIKNTSDNAILDLSNYTCVYSYAFYNNSTVEKIIFNDGLIWISKFAFVNITNLSEVFLASTVNVIS